MLAAHNVHPLTPLQPADDARRAATLLRSGALEVADGAPFAFLTALASRVCGVPYAWIALVDADVVHVRALAGLVPGTDSGAHPGELPRELPIEHSCSALALRAGAWEIEDLRADGRTACMPCTAGEPPLRMASSVPLVTHDGCSIGTLSVADSKPGRLDPEQRAWLNGLAGQVMALITAHGRERALAAARAELDALATTDAQTGLHNRRSLLSKLHFEVARTRRFRTPLSALVIGIDQFRDVNQRHGDAAGDMVLASIARAVQDSVRVIDVAGRYGGDVLCVLLPGTPREGALKLAENLRVKIAGLIHQTAGRLAPVTVSIGIGAFNHMDISDGDAMLEQAEQALCRAKANGRNRIEG
ncbi:MAG: sensor domain-containing diguanylate cyclase [Burkholderiaceae bacterium]|nr:sensor domain-containing diguanylate cyclase [Burkholderiaceae bacterium]